MGNLKVEKVTEKAVEIVEECCKSVEIILKGLVIFTMGKTAFDVNSVINEFFTKVDEILEQEKAEINKKASEKIQDLIYSQIGFLEFNFEEELEMEDFYIISLCSNAIVSTCAVQENMSTGCALSTLNPFSLKYFKSLASVDGLQET